MTANPLEKPLSETILEVFGPDGADGIFECIGNGRTLNEAVTIARKGSTVIVMGVVADPYPIDMGLVQDHELSLIGTAMYRKEDWLKSIELVSEGKIKLDHLITQHVAFDDYEEAYRLIEKYIHDMVMQGRALNLLEASAGFATERLVTAESVQMSIEKTYGIKMQASQNDDERQRLLNMESLIHERMIDQNQAVRAVSDALRRSAAGVRNEKRPIGTFLFLGPTGVGKTELAKAISDVYFHGEGTIVRIDLNEFVAAESVDRLIEDGAINENSLTSQVMKRPFSVVLLDEIEKAHPKVLTTLLQLLDEGVLRDIKNREVSFRDTIVVATSNAGADKIRQYIDEGHDLSVVKEELTNELIATGEFKPEFLNRFDEICIFKPLSKEDLGKIFDLTLKGVNKTLESQKITVEVDDDAKAILVEKGYDPKLGARPMKRVVQSYVENITAKAMLAGNLAAGGNLRIDKEMLDLEDDDDID